MFKIKVWSLFLALFFLVSCNRLDFIYTWSENFIVYEADKFLSLTSTQKEKVKIEFKKQLDLFLVSHEKEILGLIESYIEALGQTSFSTQKDFAVRTRGLFKSFGASLLPLVQETSSQLSEAQLERLKNEFRKKQEKDLKKANKEEIQKRMERWASMLGISLSREQKVWIKTFSEKQEYPFAQQKDHRLNLLEKYLESRKKIDSNFLRELMETPEALRPMEYQSKLDQFFDEQYTVQEKIINSLDGKARQRVKETLQKRRDEIKAIIEKAKTNSQSKSSPATNTNFS